MFPILIDITKHEIGLFSMKSFLWKFCYISEIIVDSDKAANAAGEVLDAVDESEVMREELRQFSFQDFNKDFDFHSFFDKSFCKSVAAFSK